MLICDEFALFATHKQVGICLLDVENNCVVRITCTQVPVQQTGPSVAVKDRPYQEVPVPLWTPQHVVQWLRSFGLDKIAVHCERADITGDQLLHLDSTRMKVR